VTVPAAAPASAGAAAPSAQPVAPGALSAPKAGSIGARAIVDVIGRADITGARLAAWRSYATGGDLRAREAALELIADHEEIEGAAAVLAAALGAKEPGLVATAAEVIAKKPERAGDDAASGRGERGRKKKRDRGAGEPEQGGAKPDLVPYAPITKNLIASLGALSSAPPDPETIDSVIDAVGALTQKEALPRLEELCRSSQPTTREHAEKAIPLLSGGKKASCKAPAQGGDAPSELASLVVGPVVLELDTDIGALSMTLDPDLAPVTVTRVVELARSGYYRGIVVHRVVPGFVTQLGAPYGDGFGGPPGRPPLRCETSPLPFETLSVGIALAGRDTGSSQLFVMHGRAPHLDGGYALVGTASGPWASFVDGDIVRDVKVKAGP
jgi:cyclophilin family peptidyl-prolyl cis-trans isomerase